MQARVSPGRHRGLLGAHWPGLPRDLSCAGRWRPPREDYLLALGHTIQTPLIGGGRPGQGQRCQVLGVEGPTGLEREPHPQRGGRGGGGLLTAACAGIQGIPAPRQVPCLQNVHLIKDVNPESTKNSPDAMIRKTSNST